MDETRGCFMETGYRRKGGTVPEEERRKEKEKQ